MSTYIVSAKRSPIGRFQGILSSLPATDIGAQNVRACLQDASALQEEIDECIVGQVLTGGVGQAPARQTALKAGLSSHVPCTTVNKVCGSGLKACFMAHDSISLQRARVVLAGGQENMSLAPHLLRGKRQGMPLGDNRLIDSVLEDGLINPYDGEHMGLKGELLAKKYQISRESQDEFAVQSYERAIHASKQGYFKEELTSIEVTNRKGTTSYAEDEEPSFVNFEKIPKLKPVFSKQGSITAANASKINDGSAFLLLADEATVKKHKLKPLAKILGQAGFAQDPSWFTTAPVKACQKVLKQQGLQVKDIDLFEINEAFSVVALAVAKDLGLDKDKLNVHGGAVALGHPIGASGARILVTLVHALKTHNKKRGLASICLGGGEALACLVESL